MSYKNALGWIFLVLMVPAPLGAWSELLSPPPPGPDYPGPGCGNFADVECDLFTFSTSTFETWYGTFAFGATQGPDLLVNVRNPTTGAWRWSTSVQVVNMADSPFLDPAATLASDTVIFTATPRFRNVRDGQLYKHILYFVYENENPNRNGGVCVMFTNDDSGRVWTQPINVVSTASSPARSQLCGFGGGTGKAAFFSVGGFLLNDTIHIFGPDGVVDTGLIPYISTPRTRTFHATASINTPDILVRKGELTSNGISRYKTVDYHFFFINGDATYDTGSGVLYLTSLYPFPYILNWATSADVTPCYLNMGVQSICPKKATTLPVRAQVYRMDIDGDFTKLYMGTNKSFELVADFGDAEGFADGHNAANQCLPRTISSIGATPDPSWVAPIDFDALDFGTNPSGTLRWYDGDQIFFLGAAPTSAFGGDIQTLCNAAQQAGASGPGGISNYRTIWYHYYDTGN